MISTMELPGMRETPGGKDGRVLVLVHVGLDVQPVKSRL